jgi:prepilin-type N-terminal cleavage/methylation domain-containing protein
MKRTRNHRGFTILELITTVALAGAAAGIAYPRLATLTNAYRTDLAVRKISGELQKTRFRAIAEQGCFRLVFNSTARTTQPQKLSSGSCSTSGTFVNDGSAKTLTDGVAIAATTNPIFNSRGGIVAGTQSTVTLSNAGSATKTIGVDLTGWIHVD